MAGVERGQRKRRKRGGEGIGHDGQMMRGKRAEVNAAGLRYPNPAILREEGRSGLLRQGSWPNRPSRATLRVVNPRARL